MKYLKQFVHDVPDFPKEGIVFKDITPLLAEPEAFATTIILLSKNWYGRIDSVAALDARGFIFGGALAVKMGLPFHLFRKKGKLPRKTLSISYGLEYGEDTLEVHEDAFRKGGRVLIVDDLLATGGTAAAACSLVEQAGAEVAGLTFVIELTELRGRDKLSGYKINSLITY